MGKENFDPALISLFKQEANKHLLKVNNLLLAIEKDGFKKETFVEIKREVHTLKGDSRMLGLIKISEAAHKLEDLFEVLGKEEKRIEPKLIQNIFKIVDAIQNASDILPDEEIDIDIDVIIAEKKETKKQEESKIELFDEEIKKHEEKIEDFKPEETKESKNSMANGIKEKKEESKDLDFISLNIKKVDDLINLFSAFPRYANRFGYILNQMKAIKDNIEKKYQDDEIDKAFELIIYDFSHDITFYDLISKQFQNEITKVKLVPLSTVFDLLPRLVRDVSQAINKKINFIIKGKEVELDKGVVEKLKEILIHILNNAVDHGCEKAEEREKLGKPPEGRIVLSAYNKGDNVIIEITDDGNGIDVDRVRQKAIEKGFITKEKSQNTSDEDMIPFIFEAGFSTREISKYSGRGIGMDVVAKTVKELNGEVKVNTWKNRGTTFLISLPLLSFYLPVTIFQLGERFTGIPSSYIMQAIRMKKSDLKFSSNNQRLIHIDNMEISLIDIQNLLDNDEIKDNINCNILIVKHFDEIAGLVVTDIVLEKKMVIKKVIGLNEKFNIIIGAVLLGNERAIPVLNIPELFKKFKEVSGNLIKVKTENTGVKKIWAKNILLVEDSLVTRDHEKNILINQNLNVFEASNGKEALKYLESQSFDLVITDIEMPVMDGIELIKNIKGIDKLKNIPIIVVTSYKDFNEKLQELGVNHFINKNDFNAKLFINLLKEEKII